MSEVQVVFALWGSIFTVASAVAVCCTAREAVELKALSKYRVRAQATQRERVAIAATATVALLVAMALCWGWLWAL